MSRSEFRDSVLDKVFKEDDNNAKTLLSQLPKIKYPCLLANLLLNGIGWGILIVLAMNGAIHNEESRCYNGGDCFCEAAKAERFFAQPANTWSNLGFTIGGIFIAWVVDTKTFPTSNDWGNNLNQITYHPWYPFSYSLLLSNLGYSSGFFHAGFTNWGYRMDAASILVLLLWFWYYSIIKLVLMATSWSPKKLKIGSILHCVLTCITFIALYACVFIDTTHKFTAGVFFEYAQMSTGGFVLIEIIVRYTYEYCLKKERMSKAWIGILASLFLITAFVFQRLSDGVEETCNPESLFQFHGMWHFLSAVGLTILFFFFLSEKFTYSRRFGKSQHASTIKNVRIVTREICKQILNESKAGTISLDESYNSMEGRVEDESDSLDLEDPSLA